MVTVVTSFMKYMKNLDLSKGYLNVNCHLVSKYIGQEDKTVLFHFQIWYITELQISKADLLIDSPCSSELTEIPHEVELAVILSPLSCASVMKCILPYHSRTGKTFWLCSNMPLSET